MYWHQNAPLENACKHTGYGKDGALLFTSGYVSNEAALSTLGYAIAIEVHERPAA